MEIEKVSNRVEKISNARKIAELEFINITPYWVGGPDGNTITCLEWDGAYCKRIKVAEVTSDTIIGLMRTVLRMILSCKQEYKTYKDVEMDPLYRRLFGGKIDGELDSSKFIITVETKIDDNILNNLRNRINEWLRRLNHDISYLNRTKNMSYINIEHINRRIEFFKLEHKYNRRKRKHYIKANKFKIEYIDDYLLIPRIKLAYMNIASMQKSENNIQSSYSKLVDEIIKNKDQYIRLIFGLPIEPNRVTVRIKIFERPGARLSVYDREVLLMLLILGMSFIGVGKAVSRGFGKFELKSPNVNTSTYKRIGRLINYIDNINKNISNINDIILDIIGLDREDVDLDEYTVLPCFLRSFMNPDSYLIKFNDCNIINTLKIIGESTLKNCIKKIKNMPSRARGYKLHTWLLGLPRSQKSTKCRNKTGYIISGDVGRHISGLFFAPLTDQRGCSESIFIIDLVSLDVPCALGDKELIHVGINPSNCILYRKRVIDIISEDCEECFDGCISIINMSNIINDLRGAIKGFIERGGIQC